MSGNENITKTCYKCRADLPAQAFYPDKSKKHGLSSSCRACRKADEAKRRADNPGMNAAYLARWRAEDPERGRTACREWRLKNPERAKELCRNYYSANKDSAREYQRRWAAENRDAVRRLASATYERNKEKYQAKNAKHYAENKELYRARDRNRYALELNCEGSHTAAEIEALFIKQAGMCAIPYCRNPLERAGKNKFHADHMTPLSRGGSNGIGNIQLTCPVCNKRKGAKTMEEFMYGHWRPKRHLQPPAKEPAAMVRR